MESNSLQDPDLLIEPLTPRERDVLCLLAEHLRYQDIAEQLTIALTSVKWYAQQIYGKLGVENRRDAIQIAQRLGLLDAPHQPAPASPPAEIEKYPTGLVTFLFTEIESSTGGGDATAQVMRTATAQYGEILRLCIESNGGQVFQMCGESFQGAFPLASDALCAALTAQHNLLETKWGRSGPFKVRMGLHTGPAELGHEPQSLYQTGRTLSRVAQIMASSHGGQILLSLETANLVERELPEGVALKNLGEHRMQGMARPETLYQVLDPNLPQEFPTLVTAITRPNNLPIQVTSFIGRETEVAEVSQLLKSSRMVTLYGSGGTGKTRLGLEAAVRTLESYSGGAWLVELASVMDPESLLQTVTTALGLQRTGEITYDALLFNYLREKELLLILDNCEHLLDACARLASDLLHRCPKLTLLTTSREALSIAGEVSYRVPSLYAPDPTAQMQVDLMQVESVRLFTERAEAVKPGFKLTGAGLTTAARLCHRLDGIPLAIELAAARVNVLSVEQIAVRLDDRFHLLTGGSRTALPRQRTLLASIEWSYNLLPESERLLLQRLSVFAGGWTLEAAEAICVDGKEEKETAALSAAGDRFQRLEDWEIFDGLVSLINKSLIIVEPVEDSDSTRYTMLETIRQYAQQQLQRASLTDGASQEDVTRSRHLAYFANWVTAAEPGLLSSQQQSWLGLIQMEIDNLRAAMEWSNLYDRPTGLRLASALWLYFDFSNQRTEGRRWLALFLDTPSSDYLLGEHAQALARLANLNAQSKTDLELHYAQASIELVRGKIDPPGLAYFELAWSSFIREEYDSTSATGYLEIAERLALQENNLYLRYLIKNLYGSIFRNSGDLATAGGYFRESLDLARMMGAVTPIAYAQMWIGTVTQGLGDLATAKAYLVEGLTALRSIGLKPKYDELARISVLQGDFVTAKREFEDFTQAWRDAGSWTGVVNGLCGLAELSFVMGNDTEAVETIREAIRISEREDLSEPDRQITLIDISATYPNVLIWMGDYAKASEWVDREDKIAILHVQMDSLYNRGELAMRQGRIDDAGVYCKRALAETRSNRRYPTHIYLYDSFADLLFRQARFSQSARFFGAIDRRRQQIGMPRVPRFKPHYDQILAQLREQLGDTAFERAYNAGHALEIDEAVAELEGIWGDLEGQDPI